MRAMVSFVWLEDCSIMANTQIHVYCIIILHLLTCQSSPQCWWVVCYHSDSFELRVTPAKMAAIKMAEGLGESQTSAPCRPDPFGPLLGLLKVRASFPLLGQYLSNTSLCWMLIDQSKEPATLNEPSKMKACDLSSTRLSIVLFICIYLCFLLKITYNQ